MHFIMKHLDDQLIHNTSIFCRDSERILGLSINGLRIIDTSNFFNDCNFEELIYRQRGVINDFENKEQFRSRLFYRPWQIFLSKHFIILMVTKRLYMRARDEIFKHVHSVDLSDCFKVTCSTHSLETQETFQL